MCFRHFEKLVQFLCMWNIWDSWDLCLVFETYLYSVLPVHSRSNCPRIASVIILLCVLFEWSGTKSEFRPSSCWVTPSFNVFCHGYDVSSKVYIPPPCIHRTFLFHCQKAPPAPLFTTPNCTLLGRHSPYDLSHFIHRTFTKRATYNLPRAPEYRTDSYHSGNLLWWTSLDWRSAKVYMCACTWASRVWNIKATVI
jgi:hypothetical protein